MAFTLAVGTQVLIGSAPGSALPFTTASNASQTVLGMASTAGLNAGDFVQVNSGWGLLDGRIARIAALAANTSITLESVDTTSTTRFPAGGGAGTVQRVQFSTQITQLTSNIQSSGGEQQFADITTLTDRTDRSIPTKRSAVQLTLPTFFDPALAWVAPVRAASDTAVPFGALMIYPNGSRTVGNAYWTLREVPTIEDSTLRGEVSIAFAAQPITYAT